MTHDLLFPETGGLPFNIPQNIFSRFLPKMVHYFALVKIRLVHSDNLILASMKQSFRSGIGLLDAPGLSVHQKNSVRCRLKQPQIPLPGLSQFPLNLHPFCHVNDNTSKAERISLFIPLYNGPIIHPDSCPVPVNQSVSGMGK